MKEKASQDETHRNTFRMLKGGLPEELIRQVNNTEI